MICDKTGKEYTRPQTKGLETRPSFEPTLIASELVSVQPMSAPVGNLFYIDFVYGDSEEDDNNNEN